MINNFFIPRKIKAGYSKRTDTYSGKLAYVIYYDNKKVLRKETSWSSWRDKKIDFDDFDNVPMEGFVLNKKVGGDNYSWNPRQTYTRVYDPRGFEIEITIPNLLFILENANSIKGKGLEGKFVYAWDGPELLLVPADCPEYMDSKAHSDLLFDSKKFKGKDMIAGATYKTDKGKDIVYLGRFPYFKNGLEPKKKINTYFFHTGDRYITVASLTHKIISVINEDCVSNYADLMDGLEYIEEYSPLDERKHVYTAVPYKEAAKSWNYHHVYYCGVWIEVYCRGDNTLSSYDHKNADLFNALRKEFEIKEDVGHYRYHYRKVDTKALFTKYPLHKKELYLKNGKLRNGKSK